MVRHALDKRAHSDASGSRSGGLKLVEDGGKGDDGDDGDDDDGDAAADDDDDDDDSDGVVVDVGTAVLSHCHTREARFVILVKSPAPDAISKSDDRTDSGRPISGN